MNNCKVYKVVLSVGEPIMLPRQPHPLMGDALLFAAYTHGTYGDKASRRTPSEWEPVSLPVVRDPLGFYHVSQLLTDQIVETEPWLLVRSVDEPVLKNISNGPFIQLYEPHHHTISVPYVYFYAEVDKSDQAKWDWLLDVMGGLHIGAKQRFHGQITNVEVKEVKQASAIFAHDRWLRPVPASMSVGVEEEYRTDFALEPPYFYHSVMDCVASYLDPISFDLPKRMTKKAI